MAAGVPGVFIGAPGVLTGATGVVTGATCVFTVAGDVGGTSCEAAGGGGAEEGMERT
ncbi:hypothetical protein ACH43Y_31625 [Streptomyces rubiginosohelvolus]|uniref:hypothetical protein n=1 Tax=Streptomyces rubiginosohelvolus TaxID=67362 RepID=UPI00379C0166